MARVHLRQKVAQLARIGSLGAFALALMSCSGGQNTGSLKGTARDVAKHLESVAGVMIVSGSCGADHLDHEEKCRLTTDQGTNVTVAVSVIDGKPSYETVSGLIDGPTIVNRLTSDLSRQLNSAVRVACPKVIQANKGDSTTCRVIPAAGKTRTIEVKILDDATGDYVVVANQTPRVAPPETTPST